ncbi:hypothetical protein AV530_015327 [Patagioenas fasciata monilis]|uniref:Uncharacterized protein n=1 Tax=Patagioenas fasciata monilis TaxID=372326 RepID=A0A1V4K1Y0_PATFA|nr:hypothetical protein AV530_015327 [Patagioenas fasciata monilis]
MSLPAWFRGPQGRQCPHVKKRHESIFTWVKPMVTTCCRAPWPPARVRWPHGAEEKAPPSLRGPAKMSQRSDNLQNFCFPESLGSLNLRNWDVESIIAGHPVFQDSARGHRNRFLKAWMMQIFHYT